VLELEVGVVWSRFAVHGTAILPHRFHHQSLTDRQRCEKIRSTAAATNQLSWWSDLWWCTGVTVAYHNERFYSYTVYLHVQSVIQMSSNYSDVDFMFFLGQMRKTCTAMIAIIIRVARNLCRGLANGVANETPMASSRRRRRRRGKGMGGGVSLHSRLGGLVERHKLP